MKGQRFINRPKRQVFGVFSRKALIMPKVQKSSAVVPENKEHYMFSKILGWFRRSPVEVPASIHRADPIKRKLRKISRKSRRYNLRTT